jgi:hypothetical protein
LGVAIATTNPLVTPEELLLEGLGVVGNSLEVRSGVVKWLSRGLQMEFRRTFKRKKSYNNGQEGT